MRKITYMEMYMVEHAPNLDPKKVREVRVNWGCPYDSLYKYTQNRYCNGCNCKDCWNREVDTENRKRPVLTN